MRTFRARPQRPEKCKVGRELESPRRVFARAPHVLCFSTEKAAWWGGRAVNVRNSKGERRYAVSERRHALN